MTEALDVAPEVHEVNTGVRDRVGIAEGLTDVLADTYRLLFKTHAYHWNVEGPLFVSIHELTEEQYEDMFEAADDIAERIRALGHLAPMTMAKINESTVIEDMGGKPTAHAMIQDLVSDHERISHRMHALIELSEGRNDPVTADLITARSAFHEQAAWMLRSIISGS